MAKMWKIKNIGKTNKGMQELQIDKNKSITADNDIINYLVNGLQNTFA